jgi:hypothetical protein
MNYFSFSRFTVIHVVAEERCHEAGENEGHQAIVPRAAAPRRGMPTPAASLL